MTELTESRFNLLAGLTNKGATQTVLYEEMREQYKR